MFLKGVFKKQTVLVNAQRVHLMIKNSKTVIVKYYNIINETAVYYFNMF